MIGIATVLWVLTALGGVGLVGIWSRARRPPRRGPGGAEVEDGAITAGKVAPHATLAIAGLLLWAVATAASDGEPGTPIRILSIALLVVAMGIGAAIVRQWKDGRERSGADAAVPDVAVLAHGALALATLVVAVIAAVGAR